MKPETEAVIIAALEMSLGEQTAKLFGVLMASPEADVGAALARFVKGLGKAIHLYESARQIVEIGEEDGV